MIATLKRREFITLLGGAAAWPMLVRGQQAAMHFGCRVRGHKPAP